MKMTQRTLLISASALAFGLAACNKPALQSSAQSSGTSGTPTASSAQDGRTSEAAPNESLKEKVAVALSSEPGLAAVSVEVNSSNGTVTLSGATNNEENRTKASQIALNVPGVKSVKNNLVVRDMT